MIRSRFSLFSVLGAIFVALAGGGLVFAGFPAASVPQPVRGVPAPEFPVGHPCLRSSPPNTDREVAVRSFAAPLRRGLAAALSSGVSVVADGVPYPTAEFGLPHETGFVDPVVNPLSTFSIDVDTASYAVVRRFLVGGSSPPAAAVRIEEMVNYFDYRYPLPEGSDPFGLVVEVAPSPWAAERWLVHLGLRSLPVPTAELPPHNLVFLLDVSGSMDAPDRLPLLRRAFALLVSQLRPQDRVSIVVYAGAAGVVLEGASGAEREDVLEALNRLRAGGSTAGGDGICLAYSLARRHFLPGGNNRILLATDGDFNVGPSSDAELAELVAVERGAGVYLSVLGFGLSNLQDRSLELLAAGGDGNYAYIDTLAEARRVLLDQLGATLFTVADDVKLQVEFNPEEVGAYRLIGYENRRLADADFADDAVDAGDLGAGHTVTAVYEVVPAASAEQLLDTPGLRYQRSVRRPAAASGELLTLGVRYKRPGEVASRLVSRTLDIPGAAPVEPSEAFRLASAVVEFALLLRDSPYRGNASYDAALARAEGVVGSDAGGRRVELVSLIGRAASLAP